MKIRIMKMIRSRIKSKDGEWLGFYLSLNPNLALNHLHNPNFHLTHTP
jgi:hypothetical protein